MLCPQTGYVETSAYLPSQEIKPRGPAQTVLVDARSALQAVGLDLIMLSCLWFIIVVTWGSLRWFHVVCVWFHKSLSCHCLYIMSPALPCKSSIQSGNSEQCVLAFIQLLSSSCTLYFVPSHTYVCAYSKCISLLV